MSVISRRKRKKKEEKKKTGDHAYGYGRQIYMEMLARRRGGGSDIRGASLCARGRRIYTKTNSFTASSTDWAALSGLFRDEPST